jgi:hypothetical protein
MKAPSAWWQAHDSQPIEAQALEDAADGRARDAGSGGDRCAGRALAALRLDAVDDGPGRRLTQGLVT